jgi:hypothetical protein
VGRKVEDDLQLIDHQGVNYLVINIGRGIDLLNEIITIRHHLENAKI